MIHDQIVTWKYECGKDTVTFQFEMSEADQEEMFMRWVDFMNAVGYTLNSTEMYEMWNGE